MSILALPPTAFAEELRRQGGRAWLVTPPDGGHPEVSAPWLQELADLAGSDERDFDDHEAVFFEVGPETGALHAAFVHRTRRGQAAGGLRHWSYRSLELLLRDGLRLSLGMSRKSALAGLWWGGGKGVIARQDDVDWHDPAYRSTLYREYGRFVTGLRGCYVTAEDVGTTPADMADVFATTRHVTCVPPELGGSGNPSPATALGVVLAMEAALETLDRGDLAGKVVAMQGAGNVASCMVDRLLERGVASIVASDISEEKCRALSSGHRGAPLEVRHVTEGDDSILAEGCDVLAPNALGGVLNADTIPRIRAPIVCGAANNQLLDDRRDDAALAERGIVYVPDFVANRMGIVNCSNEQYGQVPDDPAVTRHFDRSRPDSIFAVTRRVLERSSEEGITTSQAANRLADEASRELHPLWGHRGWAIIEGLLKDGWAERRPT